MNEIQLRPATLEDLSVLYEFEQGIVSFERPYDETLKAGHINYYDLKEMIQSATCRVIVACSKDEIVGSAYAKIIAAKEYLDHDIYAYLGFMFVKSSFRGRGINKLIIEDLKNWIRAQNVFEIRLDVYDENESAVRAYEKVGFKKQMVNMRMRID